MKKITKTMLHIYKPISGLDWMNYRIVKKDMTAHHIKKREDGGLLIIPNVAPLMNTSHEYLHIIEYKEKLIYKALNDMFRIINQQGHEPTQEERFVIEYLLQEFEQLHKEDINSKGKKLIKAKYLERW